MSELISVYRERESAGRRECMPVVALSPTHDTRHQGRHLGHRHLFDSPNETREVWGPEGGRGVWEAVWAKGKRGGLG